MKNKMKKLLGAIGLGLMCMFAVVMVEDMTADAATSGIYTYTVSNGKATITNCDSNVNGNIKIPDTLGGYPVTRIREDAFCYCSSLTSVEFPNSITSIGRDAFEGCSRLQSVYITDMKAWYEIEFEDSHANPLYYANNLYLNGKLVTNLTIPNSVASIGSYAFYGCSGLTSVEIPNSVTSIGDCAFYGCSGLTSVEIPNSVTSIGSGAFWGCSNLEEIILPFVGSHFGYIFGAPSYSSNSSRVPISLKKVVLTGSTSIASYAFYGCNGLTSVEIPNSVTSIGDYAFYGCSSLTSVEIPNSVTSIGNYAFKGCNLESISLPFVGGSETSNRYLGYIFGAYSYSSNSSYVPMSLKKVIITGSTSIASYAFYGCSSLTSVEIPNSVTSIGYDAFYGCSSLQSVYITDMKAWCEIEFENSCANPLYYASNLYLNGKLVTNLTIPNGVTSIGDYAFDGCSSLMNVEFHNSVTSIGDYAFEGCSGLTNVEIPNSVTSIGSSAFRRCSGLTNVEIPNSVTSIDYNAFYGCSGLTSIEIPNSVTSIGPSAFEGCSSLTSVEIPNSVTRISSFAFYSCSGLKSVYITDMKAWCEIEFWHQAANPLYYASDLYLNGKLVTNLTIPNSVTKISSSSFYGCSSLTSVEIPNSVTSIGDYAFSICSSLASVEIPNSVTSIGDYAFYGCSGLTSIEMPNSVTSIGSDAFNRCSNLNAVYITDLKAWCEISFGDYDSNPLYCAKNLYLNKELVTNLVIPEGVTSIGSYAFSSCSGLTSIEIPSSVMSIGQAAFNGCSSLQSVCIMDMKAWCEIEFRGSSANPLYYASNLYLNEKLVTNLTIPNSVTSIGDYAFYGCSSLTSVEIPNSVTSIGDYAFYGCSGLTSIEIPNSVTSIGDYVFSGCSSLTSVEIPNSVTRIGYDAFSGCSGLTSIEIPNSVTDIGYDAFEYCENLEEITLPFVGGSRTSNNPHFGYIFGASSYNENANCVPSTLRKVIITNATSIGSYAFYNCVGLKSIEIPSSVTSIGYNAFYGCSGLTSIEIPNSVTSIGNSVFYGCSGLTSIEIPNSVTSIGNSVFYGCSGLTSIEIPSSVTSISYNAFYGCSGLTSIEIPNSVTSIGSSAFYGCSGLTSVKIPSSVTSISYNAFYDCKSLTLHVSAEYAKTYAIDRGIPYVVIPTGIQINTSQSKIEYCIGEGFDLNKLIVETIQFDGESVVIPSGYSVSGFDSSREGSCVVTVSYNDMQTSFTVIIKSHLYDDDLDLSCNACGYTRTTVAITVQQPTRVDYCLQESLDLEGLVVTQRYSDGTTRVVETGYTTSGFKSTTSGKKTVTVTYKGYTATFIVNIYATHAYDSDSDDMCNRCEYTRTISSISIDSKPTKLVYYINDTLDSKGLAVKVSYSDGSTKIITSGYTLSGFDSSSAGIKTVTVGYAGRTKTFKITVKVKLEKLAMQDISLMITRGESYQNGVIYTPADATDKEVTWTSDDESIATVDENGVITAISTGTTIIRATAQNGLKAQCEVEVVDYKYILDSKDWQSISNGVSGITYYLMANIESSGIEIKQDRDVVIDLNGYTVSGQNEMISNSGNLTIVDSRGDGKIALRQPSSWTHAVSNSGVLKLNSGTIEYIATISKEQITSVNQSVVYNTGNFQMNGGAIYADFQLQGNTIGNMLYGIYNTSAGIVEINAGDISVNATLSNKAIAKKVLSIIVGIYTDSGNDVTITGGTLYVGQGGLISSNETGLQTMGIQNYSNSTVDITNMDIDVVVNGSASNYEGSVWGIWNCASGNIVLNATNMNVASKMLVETDAYGIANIAAGTIIIGNENISNTSNMVIKASTQVGTSMGVGSDNGGSILIERGSIEGAVGVGIDKGLLIIGNNDGQLDNASISIVGNKKEAVKNLGTAYIYDGVLKGVFNTSSCTIPSGYSWKKTSGTLPTYTLKANQSVLIASFVARLYNVCLNREPDAGGKANWVNNLKNGYVTGIQAASGFIFSPEFKNKNYCNEDYVKQLYRAFMGREADAGGLANWVKNLNNGMTREAVFNGFALSKEFRNICADYEIRVGGAIAVPKYGTISTGRCTACGVEDGVTQFVKRLYKVCLDREADAGGLANWCKQLWNHTSSGRKVAQGFIFSKEFTNKNYSNEDFVEYLYEAFMGRPSDAGGKANWVKLLNQGWTRKQVFDGFAGSKEFTNICNKYGILRD